jgi:hypothetical protein
MIRQHSKPIKNVNVDDQIRGKVVNKNYSARIDDKYFL